jgi:hypothetical protein
VDGACREINVTYVKRFGVGIDLCSGIANAGEGSKIEGEWADVGSGYFFLDGDFRKLQSGDHDEQAASKLTHRHKPLRVVASNNDKVRMFRNDTGGLEADTIQRSASDENIFASDFVGESGGNLVGSGGKGEGWEGRHGKRLRRVVEEGQRLVGSFPLRLLARRFYTDEDLGITIFGKWIRNRWITKRLAIAGLAENFCPRSKTS